MIETKSLSLWLQDKADAGAASMLSIGRCGMLAILS